MKSCLEMRKGCKHPKKKNEKEFVEIPNCDLANQEGGRKRSGERPIFRRRFQIKKLATAYGAVDVFLAAAQYRIKKTAGGS